MRPIQIFGLSLFILALGAFVAAFSLSQFQLSPASIEAVIADAEKRATFTEVAQSQMGQTYGHQFAFVEMVKKLRQQANQKLAAKYGLSDTETEKILAANPGTKYQLSTLEMALPKGDPVADFKLQSVKDYTAWMEGREFASRTELENNLRGAIAGLNASVADQKGFPAYDTKNFLFQITKKSSVGLLVSWQTALVWLIFLGGALGALLYIYPQRFEGTPGIKNNHIFQSGITNRGLIGISVGVFLIVFYIFLYFYPYYITNWVRLVDPVSLALNGGEASQWFLYGFLYTLAILVMGLRMMVKYRHSPYQIWRSGSVMFFQTSFAFIIPQVLTVLHLPYMDLKNIWPLDYDLFTPGRIEGYTQAGLVGYSMLFWGVVLTVVGVPTMTYFFGKRWYCSWVCGCGGLAETLGDPYRQLSDKSLRAWRVERVLIHSVLVFAVVMTGLMLYTFFTKSGELLGLQTYKIKEWYGFLISSIFAGVVGTGFYPFMGSRVWCRFGCPLAAYLGLVQRFQSRFRITTNGGQCISCGNCSTYCEMGIDVRWYAQRGQNIVRASCVGCGICSAVCPRGVLNLENGPTPGRLNDQPILIGNEGVKVVV
ncbi:MAG: hypothetical protein OHK0053_28030 [Microscillaceae bacterium]